MKIYENVVTCRRVNLVSAHRGAGDPRLFKYVSGTGRRSRRAVDSLEGNIIAGIPRAMRVHADAGYRWR